MQIYLGISSKKNRLNVIVDKVSCPCGGVSVIKHEPREFTTPKFDKQIIEFYYYECDDCGEKWTTTESDTISYEKLDFTNNE